MDIWFGDSWCVGSELVKERGLFKGDKSPFEQGSPISWEICRPDLAFSHLVSENIINMAGNGAGNEEALFNLMNYEGNAERAFIGLSHPMRKFLVSDDGYCEKMKREFLTDNSDLKRLHYSSVTTTNHIYLLCKEKNIEPYFFPIWFPCEFGVWEKLSIIPKKNWLVDNKKTLVQEAWNIEDTVINWKRLKDKDFYKEFIFPCGNHPNTEGHKSMANYLLSKLYSSV